MGKLSNQIGHLLNKVRGRTWFLTRLPGVRQLRCLRLRRLTPLDHARQRGTAVVRFYWARFLEKYQTDILGTALEIGATSTLRQYGGQALTRADALDLAAHTPEVTVVADLTRADGVPANTYDCFINQFTMHLIYDLDAALYHSLRILKPGGVLLVNFPCVDYYFADGLDMQTGAPLYMHWWFTPLQVENLLHRAGLCPTDYTIEVYGNLFSRIAYQVNMAAEELTRRELDYVDPGHPLLVCVRVVKPAHWQGRRREYVTPWLPHVTPAVWNPETGHYVRNHRS